MQFIPLMANLHFQHHQSSVSHGPSEIILICGFGAQETFVYALMVFKRTVFIDNMNTW